jgi:hypothetical protein
MLQIMALFFIFYILEAIMMSLFPVAVIKISISSTTLSNLTTLYPSMQAYKAQIGSTSEICTIELAAFIAAADPLPTSPYPKINTY